MKAIQNPKVIQFLCLAKAFDHAVSRAHGEHAPVIDFTLFKGDISLMMAKSDGKGARIVQVIVGKETDELHVHFFGSMYIMVSSMQQHLANNGEEQNLVAELSLKDLNEADGINNFNKRHSELAFMIWAFLRSGTMPETMGDMAEPWPALTLCTKNLTYLNKN